MTTSKKHSTRLILSILFFGIVMIATIGILYSQSNRANESSGAQSTNTQADILMAEATKAAENNETAKAKELLQRARSIYLDIKDLDGVANTDAQLYLLDHPRE